jgi:hypothetical protein
MKAIFQFIDFRTYLIFQINYLKYFSFTYSLNHLQTLRKKY